MNRSRQRPTTRVKKRTTSPSRSTVTRSVSSLATISSSSSIPTPTRASVSSRVKIASPRGLAVSHIADTSSPSISSVQRRVIRPFSTKDTPVAATPPPSSETPKTEATKKRAFLDDEQIKELSELSPEEAFKKIDELQTERMNSDRWTVHPSELPQPTGLLNEIAQRMYTKDYYKREQLAFDFSYLHTFEQQGFTVLGNANVPDSKGRLASLPLLARINPKVPQELRVPNLHKKLAVINPAFHDTLLFDKRDPENKDKQFQVSSVGYRIINKFSPHAYLQNVLFAKLKSLDQSPFLHQQYDEIIVYNPQTEEYFVPYDPLNDKIFKPNADVTFYRMDPETGLLVQSPDTLLSAVDYPRINLPYTDPGKRPTSIHTAQFEKDFKPFHEWQADGAEFPIQWIDESRLYHRNRYDLVSGPYAEQKHTNASGLAFQLTDTPHRDMFNAWERVRHKKAFRRGLKTYAAILTSFVAFELFMWGGTHFPSQEIFAELKELNMRLTYHSTIFGKSFDEVLDMPMKDVIRGLADRPLLRLFPRRDELHIERVVFDEATNAMTNTGEFMDPAKLFDNNRPNSSSKH